MSSPVPSPFAEEIPAWQPRALELMQIIRDPEEEAEAIARAVLELTDLLPSEDGIPMESSWHRAAMNLLIDVITFLFAARDDYYVGGNMFLYYFNEEEPLPQFRGPDFFYVSGVTRRKREKWCVFREGKAPHVIMELLSRSTARRDRTTKKDVYEHLEVSEYVLYDPVKRTLEGWRLQGNLHYAPIVRDERGWIWSERLGLWFGIWEGVFQGTKDYWPRFFDTEGRLVLTGVEAETQRADDEKQRADEAAKRADDEKQRADEAAKRADGFQAEVERLRALLANQERGQQHG